jgi:hypothetical protein
MQLNTYSSDSNERINEEIQLAIVAIKYMVVSKPGRQHSVENKLDPMLTTPETISWFYLSSFMFSRVSRHLS